MKLVHVLALAALALPAFVCSSAAVAQTASPPAQARTEDGQAAVAKLNAYVSLLNRTLRASDSLSRYESWVNMRTGPTGRERIVYGLYSLYDVRSEIEKARAATTMAPPMPALDAEMPIYIAAYEALAPIVTEADGYYERQDYNDDKMAGGKALHARLAPAAAAFRTERGKVDAMFAAEKAQADLSELSAIERSEGKTARWHVANVMVRVRRVVDMFPSELKPVVDMKAFEAAIAAYSDAVKEMDAYSAEHPDSFFVFESAPRSYLGKLREFRAKLVRAKGDARRVPGVDMTWLVNDYNMMVTTSQHATQFAK